MDGGQFVPFVGGHAHFVWWVVMICGSAVVVHGWLYSFCVMVGGGHG